MAEMTIRRFGVISVAKMYGLLTFIFGLIFGVIYGLFFIIFGAAMSAFGPGSDATAGGISSVVVGVMIMIGVPIGYGLMGFLAGAIAALVYNGVAGLVGGIKLEIEGVQQEYAPPPPPHQWVPNQYPAQ
jgi:hypothetical protein